MSITSFNNMYGEFHKVDEIIASLKNYFIPNGIYNKINNLDGKTIFKYIFIIAIFFIFIKNKSIGVNIILGLAIIIIIWYLNNKNKAHIHNEQSEKQIKIDNIRPEPTYMIHYDDIIDFLNSIQDMYEYNPEAYDEMMDNLNVFFIIYDIMSRGTFYCDYYYQIAESKKSNAVNALHSMIIKIPSNKIVMDKFNRAHKRLETIINDYLNKLYDICHQKVLKNGLNRYNRAINRGPKEYNNYLNTINSGLTESNNYFNNNFDYQFY